MAGFDAGAALEPLNWTLKPYVDAEGVLPEPSQDVLDRFRRTMRGITGQALDDEGEIDREKLDQMVKDAGSDEAFDAKLAQQMIDCYADVCQGSPSREQIVGLPATVRAAFYQWVNASLLDPFSRTPATKP